MRGALRKVLFVVYILVGVILAAGHHYFAHLKGSSRSSRRCWLFCYGHSSSSGSTYISSRATIGDTTILITQINCSYLYDEAHEELTAGLHALRTGAMTEAESAADVVGALGS